VTDIREYIKYLLALRYEAIIQGHVELTQASSRKR
jgi:hypothetical protein